MYRVGFFVRHVPSRASSSLHRWDPVDLLQQKRQSSSNGTVYLIYHSLKILVQMTENASSPVLYAVVGTGLVGHNWEIVRNSRGELWISFLISQATECRGAKGVLPKDTGRLTAWGEDILGDFPGAIGCTAFQGLS